MRIGYIFQEARGETDRLLTACARSLMAENVALAGAVQHNTDCGDHCDMDLQILPDGPVIRISQSLGSGSEGCRLDADALETAVAQVAARRPGARILILNKFGKHEAEGRGFREMIAEAVSEDQPVLIGINAMNRKAFFDFIGNGAEEVPSAGLIDWCRTAMGEMA